MADPDAWDGDAEEPGTRMGVWTGTGVTWCCCCCGLFGALFCDGALDCAAGCCGALGVCGVFGVPPAGWDGLLGVEPVPVFDPGWFWVPDVPGVPCVVELLPDELLVRLLGVDEFEVPSLGVEVRSEPEPVDVDGVDAEGVDVEVPVDGEVVLGVDDGLWFEVPVFEFWPGMLGRVLPVGSVVLRGVVLSPGLVPGVLRGVVPSPGLVPVVPSPGVVPGVVLGVVPSPGGVLPGVRCVGIRPSGVPGVRPSEVPGARPSVVPGTRPSPVPETRSPAPPATRASAVADAEAVGVGVLRGVDGDVGLGVEAGPDPVGDVVPDAVAEVVRAVPELGVGLLGLPPDDVLPDVPPP
ncbi:hypothetical protein [Streptomyces sp. TLI_185]|uniref:hypothetical protein n=1 Tax=Streptomyces sp. TLI_185 TaxID=2485151 RepID=UPI00160B63A0|nr:hypothetical protein [Streptomyces sp. TLI_185]